jgi:hypothetical protein
VRKLEAYTAEKIRIETAYETKRQQLIKEGKNADSSGEIYDSPEGKAFNNLRRNIEPKMAEEQSVISSSESYMSGAKRDIDKVNSLMDRDAGAEEAIGKIKNQLADLSTSI